MSLLFLLIVHIRDALHDHCSALRLPYSPLWDYSSSSPFMPFLRPPPTPPSSCPFFCDPSQERFDVNYVFPVHFSTSHIHSLSGSDQRLDRYFDWGARCLLICGSYGNQIFNFLHSEIILSRGQRNIVIPAICYNTWDIFFSLFVFILLYHYYFILQVYLMFSNQCRLNTVIWFYG